MTPARGESVEAIVLCGGRGTRLGALTAATPKPLLPVDGSPFLLHRLLALRAEGCGRIILAAGYLSEQIERFAARYAAWLPELEVVAEPEPLGTGGALQHAARTARSETVIAMNGDSWMPQPVAPILAAHRRVGCVLTMVVLQAARIQGGARAKGLVAIDPDETVAGFTTGDASSGERWVNAGFYAINRALLEQWPVGRYDLEQRFMSLVPAGSARVFRSSAPLLDIGTPECYDWARRMFRAEATPAAESSDEAEWVHRSGAA